MYNFTYVRSWNRQIYSNKKYNRGDLGLRGGRREFLLNGYRDFVEEGEKALSTDSGDGYTTL